MNTYYILVTAEDVEEKLTFALHTARGHADKGSVWENVIYKELGGLGIQALVLTEDELQQLRALMWHNQSREKVKEKRRR